MTKKIDRMHAASGRMFLENDNLVNVADIALRFRRALSPLNALQTAEAYPVISLKSNYGFSDLRDNDKSSGSGSVTNVVGDGEYTVSTGTTSGSVGCLQSVERGRYVSGSIALPGIGVKLVDNLQDDEEAFWGYFNDTEGIGFGADANGAFVFRKFDGVITDRVYQQDWDDPLDGTGQSGLTFSLNRVDIYQMPFRWYGAGPAIFEIAAPGTKTDTIQVHVIEADNGNPIVRDPNLPIRAEISNGTGTRDLSLEVYGRQFSILGVYNPNRRVTGTYRLSQSVGTTFVPLVSFRQKTAYESVSVKTSGLELLVSNANIVFEVRVGPVLTGATFTALNGRNVPSDETAVEFDIAATAISNGQVIYTGLADAGTGSQAVGEGQDIPELDLPVDTEVTLCARSVSGTATVTSVFRCKEEW